MPVPTLPISIELLDSFLSRKILNAEKDDFDQQMASKAFLVEIHNKWYMLNLKPLITGISQ